MSTPSRAACSPGAATSTIWPMRPRTSTRSRHTRPRTRNGSGSIGSGWSLPAFPRGEPHRSLLDAIVPDRPAFFESDDGHVAWANSRALAISGIDRTTPDPANGRIVRDADGEPAGTLHDGAIELVYRHAPKATRADLLDGLRAAQSHLHSLGITAWQDAIVRPESLPVYREAAEAGWLTARVIAALWWEHDAGLEQIEGFEGQRAESAVGRLRADSVKLMLDGILESQTAFVTSPYARVRRMGRQSVHRSGPAPSRP